MYYLYSQSSAGFVSFSAASGFSSSLRPSVSCSYHVLVFLSSTHRITWFPLYIFQFVHSFCQHETHARRFYTNLSWALWFASLNFFLYWIFYKCLHSAHVDHEIANWHITRIVLALNCHYPQIVYLVCLIY